MDEEKKKSEYFNDINPLSVEKSKKNKGVSAYAVEATVIIIAALALVLFKLLF